MNEHYDHIVNGTNITSICQRCGAAVVDWHRIAGETSAVWTDDGYMRPNQIKHLAWHRANNT